MTMIGQVQSSEYSIMSRKCAVSLSQNKDNHEVSNYSTASASQQKNEEIVGEPLAGDILCGKDKRCIKHKGSRDFRALIDSYSLQYQQAQIRQKKMDITKEIFHKLEHHRFLKFDDQQKCWHRLHPVAVRDKIGHALRFSNRKGQGQSSKGRICRSSSASSQSTFDSRDSRSVSPVHPLTSPKYEVSGGYYEMVQLAAERGILKDSTYTASQQKVSSLVSLARDSDESVLEYRTLESESECDLSWILKIPLLEMNAKTNKIYFVQQLRQQEL